MHSIYVHAVEPLSTLIRYCHGQTVHGVIQYVGVRVCVCMCVCMNSHIYSAIFKIQERKSDRRSKEIEQRK